MQISLIALAPRSKRPIATWREYTKRLATDTNSVAWFPPGSRNNVGAVMGRVSGSVAIDADSREAAERLSALLPPTPMRTQTPRGGHSIYRIEVDQIIRSAVRTSIDGIECDIRGEDSYVVLGGSTHPSGESYERLGDWDRTRTPFFDPRWIDTRAAPASPNRRSRVRDVDSYLARVQSEQGSNGSAGLVRACHVCREAGLSEAQATIALLRWNQLPVVRPPWSEAELARAITRAYARNS